MKTKKNHYISVSAKDLRKKCYLENGQIAYNDIMVGEIFDNYSIPKTHQKIFLKLCLPNITRTYDAFEYITYETTLVVDKPTVKGEYSCYCIGYVDEGSHISEESNYISLVVTEGSDIPEPAGPQYYTKAEVDYLIENIPGGNIEEMPYEDLVAIWNETIGGTANG